MRIKFLVSAIAVCISLNVLAQERSAFRSGYMRLGINKLGEDLDSRLSPKENIFNNRFGANRGYVFEFGNIYYFAPKESKTAANIGLDWTILSFSYNKIDSWDDYAAASGASKVNLHGQIFSAAVSSKLGPNLSINLIGKMVIDLRFQVVPTLRYFDFGYSETGPGQNGRYVYLGREGQSYEGDFEENKFKERLGFGLATGYGITVRHNSLGLSADYISGKVKTDYNAYDPGSGNTAGKEKIQAKNVQFKLSLTF